MLLGGRDGVVVEVVDDEGVAVGGEVDIEFEEQRDDGAGGRAVGGEGEQDVAVLLEELENDLRGKGRSKAFCSRREEDEVVVGALAVLEDGEFVVLRGFEGELETSSCISILLASPIKI
jgi:hypothetical protein